jgi:hypothetical protein
MADLLFGQEWREMNSYRNYPFTDRSSLYFDGGFLPDSLIIDARIYMRGSYGFTSSPGISRITRTPTSVVFQISYGANVVGECSASFQSSQDVLPILNDGTLNGCLVLNPARLAAMQALGEGVYDIPGSRLEFVPFVCELMPGPQVTSLNGQAGNVVIQGQTGIQVHRESDSVIRIDITGDPHFDRYGCVDGEPELFELQSRFLEELVVIHYVKNQAGQLIGPYASTLQRAADGSIQLVLKTRDFDPVQNTLTLRPAFRITAQGNSLIFSLAGP